MDGSAVGVCLLDADAVILHLDPSFAALIGRPKQAAPGRRFAELLPDAPPLPATSATGAPRPSPSLSWRSELGPEPIDFEARPGSGPIAHVVVARPARAADDALARRQLELIFEASPLALVCSDAQRRVQLWSRSAERAFGWTREEVVGQHYPLIPDQDTFDALWRDLEAGGGLRAFEGTRKRKDGSDIELRIHTAPLYDASSRLAGVIALLEDLTETRQLQQRAQLSQKMEAVASLASGLGHEINNLLAVVLGMGELLRLDPKLGGEGREQVGELLRATGLARELVAQLMTFGRRQVVRPEVIDLNTRLRLSAKMIRHVLGERIELLFDLEDAQLPIRVDVKQLDQVLLNLAVNAADAMPSGGRLTCSTALRELGSSGDRKRSRHACLILRDTGSGIPADVLPRIFDPFFTTKALGAGTGLGLAHVYNVVSQSGGQVEVESHEGVGTSFYLFFPLVEAEAKPLRPPAPRSAGAPTGHERILLVEDDEGVRRSTAKLLTVLGYTVEVARDGAEALEILGRDDRFDLVLTDVAMPRLNGPGLAKRMQQLHPSLPVLFMSGNVDVAELREQVARGDVSFVQKPASLRELAQATRAILDAAHG